jgi:hypothetical protein
MGGIEGDTISVLIDFGSVSIKEADFNATTLTESRQLSSN